MDDPLLNGLGPIGQFFVHQTALYRKTSVRSNRSNYTVRASNGGGQLAKGAVSGQP
jgi:hypothetical protein